MQVAVVSTGGLDGWPDTVRQALVAEVAEGSKVGPAPGQPPRRSSPRRTAFQPWDGRLDVIDLEGRPAADAAAIARAADVVVVIVGGDASELVTASDVYSHAVAAEHVTVVAVVVDPADTELAGWAAKLELEHPSVRLQRSLSPLQAAPRVADLVQMVAAVRARYLWEGTSGGAADAASGPTPGGSRPSEPFAFAARVAPEQAASAVAVGQRRGDDGLQMLTVGDPRPRARPGGDLDALGRLERTNADDQWGEAAKAWYAALWEPMVQHLRRALALRPLDAEVGLWLARLLAASQRRSAVGEAIRLADGAARLSEGMSLWHSEHDGTPRHPEWAPAAWLWAARIARTVDPTFAGGAASRAATLAPARAESWVELTIQHLLARRAEPALRSALEAYRRHEWSLAVLQEEPALRGVQSHVSALLAAVVKEMAQRVAALAALVDDDVRPAVGSRDQLSAAELARLPLPVLAIEGRTLGHLIMRALSLEAAELAAYGRRLTTEALARAGGGLAPAPIPGRIGREVFAKGAAAVALLVLCGVGLSWVFSSLVWSMFGLLLGGVAMFVTLRVAAESTVADAALAGREQMAWDGGADRFRARVEAFEAATLDWPRVLATAPPNAATVGDLLALSDATVPEHIAVDAELLPPDLRQGAEPIGPKLRLFRVVGQTEDALLASRWAAYFPSPS